MSFASLVSLLKHGFDYLSMEGPLHMNTRSRLRPRSGALRWVLPLILPALLNSCAWLGGRPDFAYPETLTRQPFAQTLTDPRHYKEAYREVFPFLPKVHMMGRLSASSGWWPGQRHFDFSFFGLDRNQLRLGGFHRAAGIRLFDVMVVDNIMTVTFHEGGQQGHVFQGPIPPEGSPFLARYGVEPGDLMPIFQIGSQITGSRFRVTVSGRDWILEPLELLAEAPGLRRILLDARSGLPRRIDWETDNRAWQVWYTRWDYFTDEQIGETRLMPQEVLIEGQRPRTRIRLDITEDSYQFGTRVPDRIFQVDVPYRYLFHPLNELDEVFDTE